MTNEELLIQAKNLLQQAYCPYSHFQVSCIMQIKDQLFKGVNIENVSFGATICAERSCIANIISNGYDPKQVEKIVICASSDDIVVPCGICRQTLLEFISPNTPIILSNQNLEYQITNIKELLPHGFNKERLD